MSELIGYLSEVEHLEGELTIPKQLGGSTLGTKTITENDTYYAEDDGLDGYSEVTVNVSGGSPTLETITKTYTPTTSQQTEQITPSSGYDGIAEVDVTVNAMPTGTEGTPTATKGAVSNHSVNVTPSVTNVAGYIAGGTKTGTAVTVSASELDSGTKSITSNGSSQDVVGYAAVDVAVPNSYSAADEGKVVSSGALVAQTAHADVTPTTSDQTIDTTTNNSIKVKGDADLVAGNVKKDVEIFGVTGTYEGGGGVSYDDLAKNLVPDGDVNLTVTSIEQYGLAYFIGKSSGWKVYGNNVTSMGKNAFQGCWNLKEAHFPALTSVNTSGYCFNQCYELLVLDLGYLDTIRTNMMSQSSKLATIILRRSTAITALGSTNAFNAGRFASGGAGGTIYIPKALYDHLGDGTSLDYQHATNWSTIYGYGTITWAKIEGSIYEL